jgi:hypothetical protein
MKRLFITGFCAALLITIVTLSAHENFRIIGTVAKVTADSLDVKQTKDGVVLSMRMNRQTSISRDNKRVDRAELKVGLHVVVDARGDTLKDLLIHTVRLVPAPTTKK